MESLHNTKVVNQLTNQSKYNFYRKPTYYEVFSKTLKNLGNTAKIKKTTTGYQTAISYKDTMQKVFFDIKNEMIIYKSLHGYIEKVDRRFKANWQGNGRVTFTEITTY